MKSNTNYTSQHIDNQSFDEALQVRVTELINTSGVLINPATEETAQKVSDKIPTDDIYITYNADNTVNTKVWKLEGTGTVVKTLTYNYSGGNLISKILS